jgi:hypothetical protein
MDKSNITEKKYSQEELDSYMNSLIQQLYSMQSFGRQQTYSGVQMQQIKQIKQTQPNNEQENNIYDLIYDKSVMETQKMYGYGADSGYGYGYGYGYGNSEKFFDKLTKLTDSEYILFDKLIYPQYVAYELTNKLISTFDDTTDFFSNDVKKLSYDNTNPVEMDKFIKDNELSNINYKYNPINIGDYVVDGDKYKIFTIQLPDKSSIWCDANISTKRTEIVVAENEMINKNDYAFVTLYFPMHNNDFTVVKHDYLLTTCIVGYLLRTQQQSLITKQVGTRAKTICMVTPDVDQKTIEMLSKFYDEVKIVPYISWGSHLPQSILSDPSKYIKINDVSTGHVSGGHPWSHVMTKINLFNKKLFPYKKVVFVDGDCYPLFGYDTLFSFKAPAGWLEFGRIKMEDYPSDSWAKDRCRFTKHMMGLVIPNTLTDLKNSMAASDVNAATLVIEPNMIEYDDILSELTTRYSELFGKGKKYDGFYLGNTKLDYYSLPEQNYLTQRYSGKWHSISYAYGSWMIDIDYAFGIHYAAMTIKPWVTQSIGQKYTINKYSVFNNTHITSRMNISKGLMTFNNILYKFLTDVKKNDVDAYNYCKNYVLSVMKFTKHPFDAWESEINLDEKKFIVYMKDLKYNNEFLHKFSADQIKLLMLLTDGKDQDGMSYSVNLYHKKIIMTEYFVNLFDPVFFAGCFHILKFVQKLLDKYNLTVVEDNKITIIPEGGTLIGIERNNSFIPWDDDIDMSLLAKTDAEANIKMMNIIKIALENDLTVAVHIRNDKTKKFNIEQNVITSLVRNPKSLIKKRRGEIDLIDLQNNIAELCMFNISLNNNFYEKILATIGEKYNNEHKYTHKRQDIVEKVPWIDILPTVGALNPLDGKTYYKFRRGGNEKQCDDNYLGISEDELYPLVDKPFITSTVKFSKTPLKSISYYAGENNPNPLTKIKIFARHGSKIGQFELPLELSDVDGINNMFKEKVMYYVNKMPEYDKFLDDTKLEYLRFLNI